MRDRIPLAFSVGPSDDRLTPPDQLVPATVPGAVQLDYQAAGLAPDPHIGEGFSAYGWMEDKHWHYEALLPKRPRGEHVDLVLEGVDYAFAVYLDGTLLHEQEGMFTPARLDITALYREGAALRVVVLPAPKREGAPENREQADHCCKPAVSYGWDWHPRYIPLGLWRPAYVEGSPDTRILGCEVRAAVSDDLMEGTLTLSLQLSAPCEAEWRVRTPGGETLKTIIPASTTSVETALRVLAPALWWPNGEGGQALYESTLSIPGDQSAARVGFRRLRLVMHEGAWRTPDSFPKSRSNPPITLEVNNRRIFGKGSNWVAPEMCPGAVDEQRYRRHLQLAKDAHMNLLRVWGGGIALPDEFYDAADELGLLIWQEFPLSCNCYPDEEGYLSVLERESRSIILRLRHRASLAIWCGGNELFNAWSGMTDQSLPLRLLNSNCFRLDPLRPFLPTSPVMGMAHGNYAFNYPDGREAFQVMPASAATAYTEFGMPGPAPVDTLRSVIPSHELWPPRPIGSWVAHGAFGAWLPCSWLDLPTYERYFGPPASLEDLVEKGQWMQAEGYRCIFEEARRQRPVCSMAVNWCFQEPWPTAANNSLLAYPSTPKPAYYAVQAACRPQAASARIERFQWRPGDCFCAEVWLLNDAPFALPACSVDASLLIGDTEHPLAVWRCPGAMAGQNARGPRLHFPLPDADAERITLILRVQGRPDMEARYALSFRANAPAAAAARALNL